MNSKVDSELQFMHCNCPDTSTPGMSGRALLPQQTAQASVQEAMDLPMTSQGTDAAK